MIHHYIIGIGAFLLLSTAWVAVQRAWKRSFPDVGEDPDVLAGRSGCHGCDKTKDCHRRTESGACEAQEKTP
jgi:hypothetical protein